MFLRCLQITDTNFQPVNFLLFIEKKIHIWLLQNVLIIIKMKMYFYG